MAASTTVPATTPPAAPAAFDWANLASYKTDGRFIDGLPGTSGRSSRPTTAPGSTA
jgi:hypothetical protein